jgi:hypothetical protein
MADVYGSTTGGFVTNTAVIDIDGTMADFATAFATYNKQEVASNTSWEFYEEWGWTRRKFDNALKRFIAGDGFFEEVLPIGGWDSMRHDLRKLGDAGYRVVFATHRPPEAQGQTQRWLEAVTPTGGYIGGYPWQLIHVPVDRPKWEHVMLHCEISGSVHAVDDSANELHAWDSCGKAATVARMRHGYNKGAPGQTVTSFSEWVHFLTDWTEDGDEPVSESPESTRRRVLMTADRLVNGSRNNQYGPPTQDFTRTAALWTVQLGSKLKKGQVVEPHEVASLMIALKLSRVTWSPGKMDHAADIAGYAACLAEVVEETRTDEVDWGDGG